MANRVKVVTVGGADRVELERLAGSRTAPARLVQRARIVLLSAEGLAAVEVAQRVGCSEQTVGLWRRRYERQGPAGLAERPRPGRPPMFHRSAGLEAGEPPR